MGREADRMIKQGLGERVDHIEKIWFLCPAVIMTKVQVDGDSTGIWTRKPDRCYLRGTDANYQKFTAQAILKNDSRALLATEVRF